MKRELFGREIKQRTDNGFFEARALERAGNAFRLNNRKGLFNLTMYLKNPHVKEFIKKLEDEFGKVIIKSRGEMWVHPLLWIDIALAIDVNLKVAAYSFLLDNLVKFRLESGDSYRKMTGTLFENTTRRIEFSKDISKLAIMIKNKIGVSDWETATEEQLKKRDRLHERIYDFATLMRDNRKAIEAAFDLFGRENQQ
jgi:hypothetical protein